MKVRTCFLFALVCLSMNSWPAFAQGNPAQTASAQATTPQTTNGSLHGQVTDPSGAAIAHANVVLVPSSTSAAPIKTQADGQGQYEFNSLAAGQYTLNVVAPGFSVYENGNVSITPGQPL